MAYQAGSASSTADFLSQLRGFLGTQGWTVHKWVAGIPQDTDTELYVSHGTVALGFVLNIGNVSSAPVRMLSYAGTGYQGGALVNPYPFYSSYSQWPRTGLNYKIWHWDNHGNTTKQFLAACEIRSGLWAYLSAGILDLHYNCVSPSAGAYVGVNSLDIDNIPAITNPYQAGSSSQLLETSTSYASRYNTFAARLSSNTLSDSWFSHTQNNSVKLHGGCREQNNFYHPLSSYQFRVTASNKVPMWPYSVFAAYDGTKSGSVVITFLAATIPNIRLLNMALYEVGQEVVEGGDTWVIMPVTLKTASGPTSLDVMKQYGFAIRKTI